MDIRELRRAARLTQLELALKSGISRMRLSLAECRYVPLTVEEEGLVRAAVTDELSRRVDSVTTILMVPQEPALHRLAGQ